MPSFKRDNQVDLLSTAICPLGQCTRAWADSPEYCRIILNIPNLSMEKRMFHQ